MEKQKKLLEAHHPVTKSLTSQHHFRESKHHVYPGLNVCDKLFFNINSFEDIVNLYETPMLNVTYPLPCSSSKFINQSNKSNGDPVLKLVRDKLSWKKKKEQLIDLAKCKLSKKKNFSADIKKALKSNTTSLPFGIVRLADHLAHNPDKYFKGSYNWYYGNSMAKITSDDTTYILHAGGEYLNRLIISSFETINQFDRVPVISPKNSVLFPNENPIYDVVTSETSGLIGIRQQHRCSFSVYEKKEDIETGIVEKFCIESGNSPYVSIDVNGKEFCTVNTNREAQFWQPSNRESCIRSTKLPKPDYFLSDKFIQVKYGLHSNSQIFSVVDRRNLFFFDKRESCKKPFKCWKPESYVEMCEEISLLIPSVSENKWYIGLTHSCLLLDPRVGFIQKWTHMLPQAPTVSQTFEISSENECQKEALILSTQYTGDSVVIHNKCSSFEQFVNSCLPVALPNRIDTLHRARMNGILSHAKLENKFHNSIIGLSAYKNNNTIGIFSLVSTGDIFHQYVEENHAFFCSKEKLTQNELYYLEKWQNDFELHCLKNNENRIITTDVVNMAGLVSVLTDETIEIPEWITTTSTDNAEWKRSKKELESYTDSLSLYLIQEFGLDDVSEWESDEVGENNKHYISTRNSYGKVESWLLASKNECNESVVSEFSSENNNSETHPINEDISSNVDTLTGVHEEDEKPWLISLDVSDESSELANESDVSM